MHSSLDGWPSGPADPRPRESHRRGGKAPLTRLPALSERLLQHLYEAVHLVIQLQLRATRLGSIGRRFMSVRIIPGTPDRLHPVGRARVDVRPVPIKTGARWRAGFSTGLTKERVQVWRMGSLRERRDAFNPAAAAPSPPRRPLVEVDPSGGGESIR